MHKLELTYEEISKLHKAGFDVSVETPRGFSKITDVYHKVNTGKLITFSDKTVLKCADTHRILLKNGNYETALDLEPGISALDSEYNESKTIVKIEDVKKQDWIDFSIEDEREEYIQNGIIHHNSGKSLVLYSLARIALLENPNAKIMIVVPTVMLVKQIFSDFIDYGWDAKEHCCMLHSGKDLDTSKPVLISTYQSLSKFNKEFFEDFEYAFIDEAHGARGNSMMNIMKAATNAFTRIGLTGTMPKEKCEYLNVVSVLGTPLYTLKSKELMDIGVLANLSIVRCLIDHTKDTRKLYSGCDYNSEQKLVEDDLKRNMVVSEIIDKLPQDHNVLILCAKVEHLNFLYTILSEKYKERKVTVIHGKIKADAREDTRKDIEREDGTILVATFGTLSTGISIKKLHHVIFASSSKSEIRVLQSIGRGLRTHETKNMVYVWDIVDDLRPWSLDKDGNRKYNKTLNYGLKHWLEREVYYNEQKFKIAKMNFKIEDDK